MRLNKYYLSSLKHLEKACMVCVESEVKSTIFNSRFVLSSTYFGYSLSIKIVILLSFYTTPLIKFNIFLNWSNRCNVIQCNPQTILT